jgi:surface antigen
MKIAYLSLFLLVIITGCTTPEPFHHQYASGYYSSHIESCVPYVRKISGFKLYGDAYSWWAQAEYHYARGNKPIIGSVLVLKKTSRMTAGHVAVVKSIRNARQINVTHSNWGDSRSSRHIIYDSMLAEDVSTANDWTKVRFWNDVKNVLGFPYDAYGFIYP